MSPRTGVRIAIVGIFAVLATMFTVTDGQSQPGRPGGITGRPGGVTGMPGGVTGVPRPPSFNPPNIPPPPTFNPPRWETVWQCGKCKTELGRGNVKPNVSSCPVCGVRFVNGGGGGSDGFGFFNPPQPPDFGAGGAPPTPPNTDPDLMPRGSGGNSGPSLTSPPATGSSNGSSDSSERPTSKTGSMILKIMLIGFGVLFLIGIAGGAFLIIAANKGSRPSRKSRKRVLDDDEDD